MIRPPKRIYYFSDPMDFKDDEEARSVLGGKGLSLKQMTLAGLAVPPGFTISTDCCREYLQAGNKWSDGLEEEVWENVGRLERDTGRRFAKGSAPMLVSVRSGAPVSMPGMMDTILNCGIYGGLLDELAASSSFWRVYARFILSFAESVHGITAASFVAEGCSVLDDVACDDNIEEYVAAYQQLTKQNFPMDPREALRASISAVFSSWNSPRAASYRESRGIGSDTGTAVNIQAMFPSVVSGVVFTRMPNDPEAESMVIESSLGLGESIVSGGTDPDRFIVARSTLDVVERKQGRKDSCFPALGADLPSADEISLSDEQLRELATLALKTEAHFGCAVDVEFGFDGSSFGLLQSRPIKGLSLAAEKADAAEEERGRLEGLTSGNHRIWMMHNLSETLKCPTPLTYDIVRYFMSGAGAMGKMYRDLGYDVKDEEAEGFLELICGRIYADPDRIVEVLWRGLPVSCDIGALGSDAKLLENPPIRLDPDKADSTLLLRLPGILISSLRASRTIKRCKRQSADNFDNVLLPSFLDYVERERESDLSGLSEERLRTLLAERRRRVLREFGAATLVLGFLGAMSLKALTSLLERLLGEKRGSAVAQTLAGGINPIAQRQDEMLRNIACGKGSMEEFLSEFGHRAVGEMELAVPRWREEHEYIDRIIASYGGVEEHNPRGEEVVRAQTEEDLAMTLAEAGAASFMEEVMSLVQETRRLLPYRERGKYYLMMGYELIRDVILVLDQRLGLNGDTFYLHWSELMEESGVGSDMGALIENRKQREQAWRNIYVSELIDSLDLDAIDRAPVYDAAKRMSVVAISPGTAQGRALVLHDPNNVAVAGDDFVLVCPSTDPGWTPLVARAKGLIVERGGMLSHGALIARDLGIPAVVQSGATEMIRDGSIVIIDGTNGTVEVTDGVDK